jgi:hypothetical protein
MSARRWPIYTMPVGSWFQVSTKPKNLRTKVGRYQEESGKRFEVRRWEKHDPNSPIVVRRVA